MNRLIHESDFSRRKPFIAVVSILMGFLLVAGIPIGIILFTAGIVSLVTFNDQGMGDIVLTFGFAMIFLGLIPYSILTASRILKQHQIRIYRSHVEFSCSPGFIPWKVSWRKFARKDHPYYMLSNHSISLVDRDLNYVNVTVHSKNKRNREEIAEIGRHLKNMGFKRITLDEWMKLREERGTEGEKE